MKRVNGTEIAIISQEIFQHDPFTRVENLKVTKQTVICDSRLRDLGSGPPPHQPTEKYKAVCYLRNTGMEPLENHKTCADQEGG